MKKGEAGQWPLNHLAIIMDGNGRWAQQRGLPRIAGHRQGVEAVSAIVDEALRLEIGYLTLFAFSSENWGRPDAEVNALMVLLQQYLESQQQKMLDNGIRLQVIGDVARLSSEVQQSLTRVARLTAGGSRLTLVLALSYGGRDEIVRAAQKALSDVQSGRLRPEQLDENCFAGYLDSAGLPDPDLLIRTSGEMRISNFLLWQLAYSELYVTDVLWPDFSAAELARAVADFHRRHRRFGLTDDQLNSAAGTQGESLSNNE